MNTAKIYYDSDGNEKTIYQMIKDEPEWTASRFQEMEKIIESRQWISVKDKYNEIIELLMLEQMKYTKQVGGYLDGIVTGIERSINIVKRYLSEPPKEGVE